MSVAETAAAMGRSEEAVKKLQARALANLRRSLTETARPKAPVRLVRVAA
jgi:DNA-directed RNA polymerase specialized sigma24 family protein